MLKPTYKNDFGKGAKDRQSIKLSLKDLAFFAKYNNLLFREFNKAQKKAATVNFSQFLSNPDNVSSYSNIDVSVLRSAVVYFSSLYMQGEISEKALESLISYVCSIFVEQEVERKINEQVVLKLGKTFADL